MKGCATVLGCFTIIGIVVFAVVFSGQLVLMLVRGELINGRSVTAAAAVAGLGGFLVTTALCVCVASDGWERSKAKKAIRRKLLARESESDEDFCSAIPEIDQTLAVQLRQWHGQMLDVPPEKIYATDKLSADIGVGYPFTDFYKDALGGRDIYEVGSEKVLDIIDKPDRSVPQCAEEIRLLTAWTAREQNRRIADNEDDGES